MAWQPPNRVINPIIIILLLFVLVSTVSADSVTPPGGVTICGYVTYANEIGIWWFNPYDPDFGGVEMWLDDVFLGNTTSSDHFYNAYSAVVGTHTFSTHTFDNSGNVNTTWVNLTFMTKEYPGCTENWTCDTCSRPVIPVADFFANQTTGTVPLAVNFTDNSTNMPTVWNWNFGDGNYSSLQNPVYTYNRPGLYSVTLNASNIAGYNSTTKLDYINVIAQSPVAAFSANATAGFAPLVIQFNDTSTNFPSMWNWSFGDTSWFNTTDPVMSNVTKSYPTGGNYTVTLYVSNSGGSDSFSQYVDVWNRTSNNFTANQTFGNVTFAVMFTDTSYNATSWFWVFDGFNTSTERSPIFNYAVPGIYSVNHSSSNDHDIFWTNKSDYIIAYPPAATIPSANFNGTPTSGVAPLTVQFNDLSTGSPTNWNWSFGDGNFSNAMSPPHIYAYPGLFSVTLNVSNSAGNNSFTRTNYINVTSTAIPPTANFNGTPTSGVAPLTVQFNDLSTGSLTNWNWSFGDGNFSNATSPPHIYAYPGLFSVTLNVSNSAGNNSFIRTNYISVLAIPTITPTQPTITPTQPTIKPTPTPGTGNGGDGGDNCRFNPTTGGASDSRGKAGEKISIPFIGNLGASECVPVVVVDISVVPAVDIQGIMVSAEEANIGTVTRIPGNPKAYFLDINWYWVRDADIKNVYITFSVDDGWIKQLGITPENLVMLRYYDNSWHETPTQITEHSNGRYYYVASASGVSYFAVTYKGALASTKTTISTRAAQTTIPRQTLTESVITEPTRLVTYTTIPKKPVTTTTTVPPITSEEPYEIPIIWIIIGIGAFIGFVLIVLLVRRWWIRRQNPALFRKYD